MPNSSTSAVCRSNVPGEPCQCLFFRFASTQASSRRSESESLFGIGLRSNLPLLGAVFLTFVLQMLIIYLRLLNPVFRTEPLSAVELMVCLGAAAIVFAAVEIAKGWRNRKRER